MKLQSYVNGAWHEGVGGGKQVFNAVNGDSVCEVNSDGIDFQQVLKHGREKGSTALRALTFHDRANRLKAMAKHLKKKKDEFDRISSWTGATKADSWVDIEGGVGTCFAYSSLVRREFPNDTVLVEGAAERLSAKGTFSGRHILTSKQGIALHINAFNFPCWGMLEKVAPSLLAGMAVIVKPATNSAYLTEAMVREMIAGGFFPEGAIQLICGGVGDIFEHLQEQDVVTFTGSAATGRKLKTHPNIVANSIPFNMEADSLNCSILGKSVEVGSEEFDLYIKEVAREMTVKAGQKCTAIRRAIVPQDRVEAVAQALSQRLSKISIGDPSVEGVRMGPLVGRDQMEDVWQGLETLQRSCDVIYGGNRDFEVTGGDKDKGAFFPTTLLHYANPLQPGTPHDVEVFGPVSTLMPYNSLEEATAIAKMGKGSLAGSVFTYDNQEARDLVLDMAAYHGRILIVNRDCAAESTGHGSPLPMLVHGGPGRAGGGEELGGDRAIKHYMQRTALQSSPTILTALTQEYHAGGATISDATHPFKKYFEDLQIGETLKTHRRTVTEADVVNFGCVSGDHFYAHFDAIAAKDSLFGERVAHGYFVISAAAGMFVEPSPGPVLANYGMDNLRFVEPVKIGDTIQVSITVKRKIKKDPRTPEEQPNGVVVWAVAVVNQEQVTVALYDILTLVARREA